MASVVSQSVQEVTVHAQRDSLEDAREICADDTYLPNNLHIPPVAACTTGILHEQYAWI